jgi:cobalt-zinc-cadmium resistance protein CzcA
LERLIQFALTQRLLMLLAAVLLAGAGWHAVMGLPIDAFPDISTTQVKVIVKAPGMTPEEVETRITAPIEVEMLGIPRQTMLRSVSKYALADITVDFEEDTDIYWARQQVAERLNAIWEELPPDLDGGIAPMTTPLGEMFMFTVEGQGLSIEERRTLLDWVIRPALRTVPGVADVNALGGLVRTFEVVPDPARLNAQGLTLEALAEALQANNRNDGAGRLIEGEEVLLVRAEGAIRSLDDLANIVVKSHPLEPLYVHDVAEVRIGAITRYGAVTQNGRGEAVEGLVLGLRGANARELVLGVRDKLKALKPALPEGVEIRVFYDRSDLVDRAVDTVAEALGEATVLVLVLLVLFLGNPWAALTVAAVLPLAALATFVLMHRFGMSANLMSLGGLAIAIGMLVDAAVVVVENVVSELARSPAGGRLPRLHLIYAAVRDVAGPVTTGILIIMVVFLPLLTLQGLEGKLFSPVAITIMFALGASLVLALTVIPVIASYLLREVKHSEPWVIRVLHRGYRPLLAWALGHERAVVSVAIAMLAIAVGVYLALGKSFMPTLDEGSIIVQLEKLPSISLEESLDLDLRVQGALLKRVPEITEIVARTGSDEIGLDPMGLNQTDTFMVLKPREEWRGGDKGQVIEAIRDVLEGFPGLVYAFTQPIEMRVSEMLTGVRGDVAVKVFGSDIARLNALAARIAQVLSTLDGAEDVYAAQNEGVQYLRVAIDRLAVGRMGLSVDTVEQGLRTLIEGRRIGTVYEGARRTPLIIRSGSELRASPVALANLLLTLDDGRRVPLQNLARIERVEGPVMINRERASRTAVTIANVSGRDLVGFVEEAKRKVAESVPLPQGYSLEWGGQFENQQRAAARLSLVIPIALGLIFLLLFTSFRSVGQSLLVLSNIPFALVGGVVALWVSGEYLSVPASVGFIALLGIAVLNGVVLVSYFNQQRALGLPLAQTVMEGAERRLRPVMMTATIAAFGLLPLLFASGPGSEIQRPLAIVVTGGLVTSTLLTLVLLPILYRRFAGGGA